MDKLKKYLSEKRLSYSKKDIEKALDIIADIEKSPAKITDWDSRGKFEIEFEGKREWVSKKEAANKLFFFIQ